MILRREPCYWKRSAENEGSTKLLQNPNYIHYPQAKDLSSQSRSAVGGGVNAVTNRTRRSGNIRPARGFSRSATSNRRSLVAGRTFSNESVKDVSGHFVNHVVGLDTKPGLNGRPALTLYALPPKVTIWLWRMQGGQECPPHTRITTLRGFSPNCS
jgi:hypothetical protein